MVEKMIIPSAYRSIDTSQSLNPVDLAYFMGRELERISVDAKQFERILIYA